MFRLRDSDDEACSSSFVIERNYVKQDVEGKMRFESSFSFFDNFKNTFFRVRLII